MRMITFALPCSFVVGGRLLRLVMSWNYFIPERRRAQDKGSRTQADRQTESLSNKVQSGSGSIGFARMPVFSPSHHHRAISFAVNLLLQFRDKLTIAQNCGFILTSECNLWILFRHLALADRLLQHTHYYYGYELQCIKRRMAKSPCLSIEYQRHGRKKKKSLNSDWK